jgi:hypothetical protein
MVELMRTNDLVLLGFASALLRDAGLRPIELDGHMSVLDGSIPALQRRLMVADEDAERARRVLEEADLPHGRL